MTHDCRRILCDTPHDPLDSHPEACGCRECHEVKRHRWPMWNVYPECEFCEAAMLEHWALELEPAA